MTYPRENPRAPQPTDDVSLPSSFDGVIRILRRFGLIGRGFEEFDDVVRWWGRIGYARFRRLLFWSRGLFKSAFEDTVLTQLGERRHGWLKRMAQGVEAEDSNWKAEVYLVEPPSLDLTHQDGWSDVVELRNLGRPALGKNRYFGITVRGHHERTPEFKSRVRSFLESLTRTAIELENESGFPRELTSRDPAVIHYLPSSGRAEFRPSLACNHHCGFCNSVSRDSTDNTYAKKDFLRLLDRLDRLPICTIAISGGEPTLVRDLPRLVELASARGYGLELQTNGMALAQRAYAHRLRKAGITRLLISLHSADPGVSDGKITHFDGGWKKTIAGIENALDLGFRVDLSYVTHTDNMTGAKAFFEMVAQRWGRRVHIRFAYVAPTGAAREQIEEFVPDMAEAAPYLRDAFAYAATQRLRITVVGYCGIPPCLLGPGARFSSVVKHLTTYDDARDHIRLEACDACFYKKRCPGLWRKYHERYGDPGLNPLRRGAKPLLSASVH